jgi:starch synthase (maltosyl-transferring)
MEHTARDTGSEEYRDSEKYQLRHWQLTRPDSLAELIARINRIRREQPALQSDAGLQFHRTDNEALIVYSKRTRAIDATSGTGTPAGAAPTDAADSDADVILTVVNLDPHHTQAGWLDLDLAALGVDTARAFQAHDLLSGARFLWRGARNYVALDPQTAPAHVLRIRHHVRSERDFDYFL